MTKVANAALKAVENGMNDQTQVTVTKRDDPAPNPVDIAEQRAQQLHNNITTQGLDELRKMRDQLDELMHGIQESHEALVENTINHARKVSSCITAKGIIHDALEALKKDFKSNPVVTQK